jgi:hypothetical protein
MGATAFRNRHVAYRAIVLGLLLLVAGCASNVGNANSGHDKNGSGFYGGMIGGSGGLP